jgi:hypothetical protein
MKHTHDISDGRRVTDPLPIPPSVIASTVHLVLASGDPETAAVLPEILVPESLGRVGGGVDV